MKISFAKSAQHLVFLLLCLSLTLRIYAEKRYYFTSKIDLPNTAGLETVDMRPNNGRSTIQLNNLTSNDNSNYINFDKPYSSWWSFNQTSWGAPTNTNMSDINGNWYIKFKIKTTITYTPINLILNGSGTTSCIKLTSNLPRNGTWTEFTYKLSDYPTALTYSTYASNPFFQMHSDYADAGTYLSLEYVYLTNVGDIIPSGGITLSANKVSKKITFTDNTSTLTLAPGVVLTVDSLVVPIAADGSAPQIILGANSQINAGKYIVEKKVTSDKWSVLSVPFDYSTGDIILKSSSTSAIPGVDLSIYKSNTNIFAANYPSSPDNVWQQITTSTIISTALTAPRNTGVSYAIAMKMDAIRYPEGETLIITGDNIVLTGVDKTLTTVWASGAMNVENFNFVGTPFLGNYTGVITSPNSTAGGRIANLGMTTYTYIYNTDNYLVNVPCIGAATYRPYDAFFCQAYENTSTPFIPIQNTSAVYNVLNQYKVGIDGVDQVNIIESTGSNINFIQNEDGVKLFGMNAATSAIYTLDGSGIKMSVSAMPTLPTEIILGVKLGVVGSHTISILNPLANKVYTLFDNATSTETDITNTPYTFTTFKTGLVNDRFILKIRSVISVAGYTVASSLAACPDCNLFVSGSGLFNIDTPTTFNSITVAAGGKITNSSSLTATTLNLNSDATGTGTYVDNGTTIIANANVQQYLTAGRNWYVSSPVAAVSTGALSSATSVVRYDEPTGLWESISGNLNPMKGYISTATTGTGVVTFSGTLNTGIQTTDINGVKTLTRTGSVAKPGFNLVGNPYPSYVDWNAATKTNLETTYWYRTKTAPDADMKTTYVFDTYNATGGQKTNLGATTVSNLIPPMQAFWVRVAENQTSGTLTFTNLMRSHSDFSGNIMKVAANAKSEQKVLRLEVSNGTNKDEALIYFDANALNSFDAYDSHKMSNGNSEIPEIYTLAGNEQVVINGLNRISETEELPLGFTTGKAGNFTIKAAEINNFDTDTQIILKDNLKNSEQDLKLNSTYNFSSDVISSTDRFNLIFKAGTSVSSVPNIDADLKVSIYKNADNQLVLNFLCKDYNQYDATIYNAVGIRLAKKHLSGAITIFDRQFVPGVYFVTIATSRNTIINKVILN